MKSAIRHFGCAMFSITALAGCAVIPTVQYHAVRSAADMNGMTDSFYRQRSEIQVSISSAQAKDKTSDEILVVSKPKEFTDGDKLAIKAVTSWRSSTVVTVNKVANTDLVSSIDSGVTDNTAKAISSYGAAVVAVLGFLDQIKSPPCISPEKPVNIKLPLDLDSTALQFSGSGNADKCISIKAMPLPPDYRPAADIPMDVDTNNYYYSACREVVVTIKQNGTNLEKVVRVADPRYVQFVQFPPKGTVSSHSECGISVKTESGPVDNGAAIIEALATQAKAIRDAANPPAKK